MVRSSLNQEEEVILTANGQPFAIVAKIRPDKLDKELLAIRRARAKVALDGIRTSAEESGTARISMQEVDAIIRKVRRKREPA
jgi:hypothetical protein